MTRDKILGLAVVAVLLIPVIPTFAEVVPEVTFRGGYTDNLFNDSSSTDDSYTAVSPQLKIYPSSSVELKLGGSYTSYFNDNDVSNFSGNVALTFIPTTSESRFGVMLSGAVFGRHYGTDYQPYDNRGFGGNASFSLDLPGSATLRFGGSATVTEYPNSITGDNSGIGLFAGLNVTPYGSNSVNIEAGYDLDRYVTDTNIIDGGGGHGGNASYILEGQRSNFQTLYYSVRYSRPFGKRIGVGASVTQREFIDEAEYEYNDLSVDFLSPWYSLWEGWTAGVNVKSFPGASFIVETGFAYIEKDFAKEKESNDVILQRSDERTSVYLSVERPFSLKSGKLIKPGITVSYYDNKSNFDLYQFSYLDITAGVSFRF